MQFTKIALVAAAAAAAPALAQDLSDLFSDIPSVPSDLAGLIPTGLNDYISQIAQNTAAAEALAGVLTASGVVAAEAAFQTASDYSAAGQSLEAAVSAAIASAPASQQAIITSYIGMVTSIVGADLAAATSASPSGSNSVSQQASATHSSATHAASSQTSTGGAAQPTVMAFSALVGAVAGVAMIL